MRVVVFSFFAQCLQALEIQIHKNLYAKNMKKTYKIICICQKDGLYLPSSSGKSLNEQQIFIHLLNFFSIMERIGQIYDYLIENQLFSDGELSLLCCINGYSVDTLNNAIFARYGFRDFESLKEDLE